MAVQTREATLNKLRSLEFVREDLEKEKNALIDDRIKIEGEIEVQKKQADQARKRMEESVRERDLLNKMKTQVISGYISALFMWISLSLQGKAPCLNWVQWLWCYGKSVQFNTTNSVDL